MLNLIALPEVFGFTIRCRAQRVCERLVGFTVFGGLATDNTDAVRDRRLMWAAVPSIDLVLFSVLEAAVNGRATNPFELIYVPTQACASRC